MKSRYRRLWRDVVIISSFIAITPLLIMAALNYYEYRKAFKDEMLYPMLRLTSVTKRSLEFFLEERKSALIYIVNDKSFEELSDKKKLGVILMNLKASFGGFVDIGLIDSSGRHRTYVGPYELEGKEYREQDWFNEVILQGVYISDVYLGYRKFPHFVLAVKYEKHGGDFYILRATIDTEILNKQIQTLEASPSSDIFIVNRSGVLQTPSQFNGNILDRISLPIPPYSENAAILEKTDETGKEFYLSYAYIEHSPFVFMMIKHPESLTQNWLALRSKLLIFLIVIVLLMFILINVVSYFFVNVLKDADIRRDKALHEIEYTNKMASIGRLAAGVAHEVNNPLAIINEKAGLVKDLIALSDDFPEKNKIIKNVDSILNSVDRCSTITHRLLGFAKHMDIKTETIDLSLLIKEVLGFLEKEASFRNIKINLFSYDKLPSIKSDRGQLQQVFLNIINNAFSSVDDKKGEIDIDIKMADDSRVNVTISDNGAGIPEKEINHIFEPFFTTKKYGTGLGLSITYGIVKKLGGTIDVKSTLGKGTSFSITLPIEEVYD